jgi:hypothetical protein
MSRFASNFFFDLLQNRRMLRVFEPIRESRAGTTLSTDQLINPQGGEGAAGKSVAPVFLPTRSAGAVIFFVDEPVSCRGSYPKSVRE